MKHSQQVVKGFLAASLSAAACLPQAFAGTATGTMGVSLTIPKACTLTVAQDIGFSSQSPTSTTTLQAGVTGGTTNGRLSVDCRKQTAAVTVTLASASTGSSSGGTMSNGTSTLAYNLYLPKSTTWSSTDLNACDYSSPTGWPSAGLSFSGWASSGAKSIAVCANTTIDGGTESGSYSDTVNVTLTY